MTPDRIVITGMPRLDRIHRIRTRGLQDGDRSSKDRPLVLFFSFNAKTGLPVIGRKAETGDEILEKEMEELTLQELVRSSHQAMVDLAKHLLSFTQAESCGGCVVGREGTGQMLGILTDITEGRGKPEDIDLLLELGEGMKLGSLCALGKTAPNPVLTTIQNFREEYEAHIKKKQCPAGICQKLVS